MEDAFGEAYAAARKEGILFVVLTVALTPVAMVLAVVGILLAACLVFRPPAVDSVGFGLVAAVSGRDFATAFNVLLGLFLVCFLFRFRDGSPRSGIDVKWVWSAAAVLAVVLVVSHATSLVESHPGWFWCGYVVLVVVYFGLLGRAYQPAGDYYLGLFDGRLDDPFTLRDDLDRAHVALGCAVLVPEAIIQAYGEVAGGGWMIRGLTDREQRLAADFLRALATRNPKTIESVRSRIDPVSAPRIWMVLDRMGLVRLRNDRPELTLDGRKLVEDDSWS